MKEKIAIWKIDFERYCKSRKYAKSTTSVYWGSIESFIWHFKTVELDRINWKQISDYILRYDSSRTINQKKYAIQLFYSIVFNQYKKLERMPSAKVENKIPEILTAGECMLVFSKIDNLKHRAMIHLTYACGLRISEPLGIRIRHISKVGGTLFIEQSKGAKDRVVPIPDETLNLLREYFKEYVKDKAYTADTFLFQGQSKNKEEYSASSLRQILKRACKKAGVFKKIKYHSLRHSRATHLKQSGWDIKDLAEFLGHNSTKTTEIYLHTGVDDLQDKMRVSDLIIKQKAINENNRNNSINGGNVYYQLPNYGQTKAIA